MAIQAALRSQSAPASFSVHRYIGTQANAVPQFDLRLQIGDVLKGWEIQAGPSFFPGEDRFAAPLQDTDTAFIDYESKTKSVTIEVWDNGPFYSDDDPQEALKKGAFRFTLAGGRMQGAWRLQRDRTSGVWSLHKEQDSFAMPASESARYMAEEAGLYVTDGSDGSDGAGDQTMFHRPHHPLSLWAYVPDLHPHGFGSIGKKKQEEEEQASRSKDPFLLIILTPNLSPAQVRNINKAALTAGASVAALGVAAAAIMNKQQRAAAGIPSAAIPPHIEEAIHANFPALKAKKAQQALMAEQQTDATAQDVPESAITSASKKTPSAKITTAKTEATKTEKSEPKQETGTAPSPEPALKASTVSSIAAPTIIAVIIDHRVEFIDEHGNKLTYLFPYVASLMENELLNNGILVGYGITDIADLPSANITSSPRTPHITFDRAVYLNDVDYTLQGEQAQRDVLQDAFPLIAMTAYSDSFTPNIGNEAHIDGVASIGGQTRVDGASYIDADPRIDVGSPPPASEPILPETYVPASLAEEKEALWQDTREAFNEQNESIIALRERVEDINRRQEEERENSDDNNDDRGNDDDNTSFNADDLANNIVYATTFAASDLSPSSLGGYYDRVAENMLPYMKDQTVIAVIREDDHYVSRMVDIRSADDIRQAVASGAVEFRLLPSRDAAIEEMTLKLRAGGDISQEALATSLTAIHARLHEDGIEALPLSGATDSGYDVLIPLPNDPAMAQSANAYLQKITQDIQKDGIGVEIAGLDEQHSLLAPYSVRAHSDLPVNLPVSWQDAENKNDPTNPTLREDDFDRHLHHVQDPRAQASRNAERILQVLSKDAPVAPEPE